MNDYNVADMICIVTEQGKLAKGIESASGHFIV